MNGLISHEIYDLPGDKISRLRHVIGGDWFVPAEMNGGANYQFVPLPAVWALAFACAVLSIPGLAAAQPAAASVPRQTSGSAPVSKDQGAVIMEVVLHKYPLGSITGEGWLKEDLDRLAKGMGGGLQGFIDPYWNKGAGDWESEFACKALLGQVLLGWGSGDKAIQNQATANIDRIVSAPFKGADGYVGFAREQIRGHDYLGWPANQEIRALLLFYEANPFRTDVRDAARDYSLWFARNWNPSVYGKPENSVAYELPGHGYVGLEVIEAVLETFRYYPEQTTLLDWAKAYQEWYNNSSAYGHTKVSNLASPIYWPQTHAGAIGLTIRIPGILSSFDPSLHSYRSATLSGLQRIIDLSASPAGGIDDKGERLTQFNGPYGDMEYCNFQCYQEDFWSAGAISGQPKWFDYAEKMIYNAAKGATRKDWSASAYMSRVNQYATLTNGGNHHQEYKWVHDPPCCTCSAVISLPLFVSHMFMHDAAGNIMLSAYGPCQLRTEGSLLLTETTEYPFDKRIALKFAKAFDKGVGIKIPLWCDNGGISVMINGKPQDINAVPGTFAIVRKTGGFFAGDSISIVFDKMDSIEVKRHPQVSGYVWIERGPLTFACEVPTKWDQYPLKEHYGYNLAPSSGSADLEEGYYIDYPDSELKSTARILTSTQSGYPWENSSVKVRIKVKSSLDKGNEKAIDLVPYGCTALRKTCFEDKPVVLGANKRVCFPDPKSDLGGAKEGQFKAAYDGTQQKYLILLPQDFAANAPHDLLMAFHGYGSDRMQYITQNRGECLGAREVAARHNMIFVSPDYRAPAGWMGPAAEADTVQLLAELKKTYNIRKVFLVGASMGGAAVLTFATLHPDLVDGVSSQNGTANLLDYNVNVSNIQAAIKNAFGGHKDETPEAHKKRDPGEYQKRSSELHPEKFTMPVSFTIGGKDEIVPPDSVVRLAEALRKTNPHVLLIKRPTEGHSTNREDTVAALEFVIENAGKPESGK